jgi:HlyD family secretion protein
MPGGRWQAVRPWVRRGLIELGVLAAGAAVASWVTFAPLAVEAHPGGRGPVAAEVFGTGTLEARVKVPAGPKVAGRLRQVAAEQGDRVSAGTPLLRLDDSELAQQVSVSEANLEAARAALGRHRSEAGLAQARSYQAR